VPGPSIAALVRVPLFMDLEESELQLLAASMWERTFLAGEAVMTEGEPGDGFFVVESGEAEVTVQGQPRATFAAGDYFGETALLMGSDRTATITATSDLHCYGLSPADFRLIVEGNPSIAWKVMQSMADTLPS
jgi:cAMP-dependent protein kinase regulator